MAKALVVDDSRAIRMILGRMLSGCGFEICQAGNGREGLEVLEKEFPNVSLVLADWNMPEMNGLEFVQKLRADARYASVQVMMVTTETQIEQMSQALEAGANEYVMKPFTPDIIQDKLRLLGVLQ
ncbi:MAG: response regulator [Terriglobales bacterium]|jgi:two-component system chemotaxis response regulator CheY